MIQLKNAHLTQTLENTEGTIKNGRSRKTGNTGHTRRRKTQHNMCCTAQYANKKQTTQKRHEPYYKHQLLNSVTHSCLSTQKYKILK